MDTSIDQIDVYTYESRYGYERYEMSLDRVVTALRSTVVRVTTTSGIKGYGEVCPAGSAYLPAFAGGVEAALRELGPQLIGAEAANLGAVNTVMDRALNGHVYAKSPVDMACWDVLGKAAMLPVATLLGGIRQERFPLYVPVSRGSTDETVAFVKQMRAEGIHKFQLKAGGAVAAEARRVKAVVDATDEEDIIIVDANGGWRLQDATLAAGLLERLPRVYIEQPCPTMEECLAVRQLTKLPFVLDEVITDIPSLVRAYGANGLDSINCKISRLGGLTKTRMVRDVAVNLGLKVTIEDAWGGDLTTAAVSHLAASTEPDALFTVPFSNDWTLGGHLAGHQPRSKDGFGYVPLRPGLGIDVDEELLGAPVFSFSR